MRKPRRHLRTILIASAIAAILTAFFHVHEALPPILRAPTSLLLTPVAVCSGMCHYLHLPLDFYGSVVLQFVANLIFLVPALLGLRRIVRWRGRSNP